VNEADGFSVVSEKHTAGIDDHEVWLYTLVGGKHEWPGTWGNRGISASEEIWKFFELCVEDSSRESSIAPDGDG
jgi:polyhydroxybutyrate depolymerase